MVLRAIRLILIATAGVALLLPVPGAFAKARQFERSAPEPPLMGFDAASPGLGFNIPGGPIGDIGRARGLGSNVIRLAVRWDRLEPAPGQINTNRAKELDEVIDQAHDRKIGVMLNVLFSPCWASSAPKGLLDLGRCNRLHQAFPPTNPATYGSFVKRIVNRWGEDLVGVEVWNEPNVASFWQGTPQQYVPLVQAARTGIKASHYRKVPVVGGSISGVDPAYLKQLLAAGLARWSDAISIHPYDLRFGGPGFGDPSIARPGDIWSFAAAVPAAHSLVRQAGSNDPLWITEFGYANCPAIPFCVSEAVQADWLRKAAELAAGWNYVDAFLIYRLRDWTPQDGSMNAHFGVLNRNGSRKPAANALVKTYKRVTRR